MSPEPLNLQLVEIVPPQTDAQSADSLLARRTAELRLVARVSASVAGQLDLGELLQNFTDLTKQTFALYHAHVYLLDEARGVLALAAGAGEPGRLMQARGHAIPLAREQSLVARAARTAQGVIVNDVLGAPNFLPNPLLPNTRSELSVPLIVANKVIGVLDVQAEVPNRFDEQDILIQQALADQIAVAVQNARLYTELKQTSLSLVLRDQAVRASLSAITIADASLPDLPLTYVNPAFTAITGYTAEEILGRNCRFLQNDDHDQPGLVQLRAAIREKRDCTVILRNYRKNGEMFYNELKLSPIFNDAAELTHFVGVSNDVNARYAYEDVIRKVAVRSEQIAGIAAALSQATDEAQIMSALSGVAAQSGAARATLEYVEMDRSGALSGLVRVATWTPTRIEAHTPNLPSDFSALLPFLVDGNLLVIPNTSSPAENYRDLAKQAVDAGYQSVVFVPLKTGDQWVGVLTINWSEPQTANGPDDDVTAALQPSLASVVASRRNRLAERQALADNAALLDLSIALNTASSIQDMTERAAKIILTPDAETMTVVLYENLNYDTAQSMNVAGVFSRVQSGFRTGVTLPVDRGQINRIVPENGVVVYDDLELIEQQSLLLNTLRKNGVRSVLATPLQYGGRWIGNMVLAAYHTRHHSEREIRLVRAAAEQIAAAIERLTLLEQTQRRARDLEIVRRVSTATATILDTDTMLTRVCDLTKEGFDLYHVHIYLLDEDAQRLVLRAGAGAPGRIMRERGHGIAIASPRSLVARAARTRAAVIVNDVTQVEDFLPNPLLPETRSEMAVPMIVGDRLLGVMDVQSTQTNRFQQSDIEIKTALGEQVSVAVQNALLYAREVETTVQLRELDRLKSEFLASMSHELRTPLNSILGYAEVLADGIDGELPEEAVIDIGAIHESGQHLLGLINDILDLSKIEAGHMELDTESIPLSEVVEDVARIVPALIREKPVTFITDIPDALPTLLADRQRLRQILTNLVSNAIKFTDHGSIRLEAVYKIEQQQIEITVRDTGVGIAPEHLDLIFEQFRQVDNSSTRRVGGTGLGLPITQRLVRMHGGEIRVESTPGSGSAFIFTIPAAHEIIGS